MFSKGYLRGMRIIGLELLPAVAAVNAANAVASVAFTEVKYTWHEY